MHIKITRTLPRATGSKKKISAPRTQAAKVPRMYVYPLGYASMMPCEHIFTYIIYALYALKILLIHKKVCVRCTQISPFFVYAVHKFFRYTNNILQLCELYVIYLRKTLNRGHSNVPDQFIFHLFSTYLSLKVFYQKGVPGEGFTYFSHKRIVDAPPQK